MPTFVSFQIRGPLDSLHRISSGELKGNVRKSSSIDLKDKIVANE
jgi:hypothetical protein